MTGIGLCVPGRPGRESAWGEAQSGARPVATAAGSRFACGEVRDFDPASVVDRKKALKLMGPNIQFALHASREAWTDSGRAPGHPDGAEAGTVLGVRVRPGDFAELAAVAHASLDESGRLSMSRLGEQGMAAIYPLSMLKNLPNMVAAHVTIQLGLNGFTDSLTSGDVSGLQAVGEAFEVIRRGDAGVVLAGGADDLVEPLTQGPVAAQWRARGASDAALAQGSAVLVLEARDRAKARGARVYGEIAAFVEGFGPVGAAGPIEALIRRALAAAGIGAEAIGTVWVDACGLPDEDAALGEALAKVFEGRSPRPRLAGQARRIGHSGAASGAVEAAFAALALGLGQVPAFLGPGLGGLAVSGDPPPGARRSLVLSIASTGGLAALVLVPEATDG